jgi:KamA family protein
VAYTRRNLDKIPALRRLGQDALNAMKAVSAVLPFRVNRYVIENLIDWDDIPADPMFQLTFPQPGMLERGDFEAMLRLVESGAEEEKIARRAREIQLRLNPHPAGQLELNRPRQKGATLEGIQHKYRETVLFFPSQGQTCHAYCTYCFRWAQFVGLDDLKFASREAESLADYVRERPEVSSVLLTGGDPMIMRTRLLRRYIEPLLRIEHLTSIRIGTKSLSYWPYRFTSDADADDVLRLFDEIRASGKHLALMAHFSHPRELSTVAADEALRAVQSSGAVVRTQAPLIRRVNDDADTWAEMWRMQVSRGAIPYYMFVERDTGPKKYFEVPLARALKIYRRALRRMSGLGRTVRGPSMSASPGKIHVLGTSEIAGEKVFVLSFLQGRDPEWVGRPFFARFDDEATWIDDLTPAFGEREFFFEPAMRALANPGSGRQHTHARTHRPGLTAPRRWHVEKERDVSESAS